MILGTSLAFVRHAQSIGNTMTQDERASLKMANRDYPLTYLGKQQAEMTGDWLKRSSLSEILREPHFCSTFRRTEETLRLILKTLGRQDDRVIVDPRLDEKWDGIFHELSKSQLQEKYSEEIRRRKQEGYYHYRAPRGENCPDVEERIHSFAAEHLLPRHEGLRLVVGHGRWFIVFQKLIHHMSIEEFLTLKTEDRQRNCAVNLYDRHPETSDLPTPVIPWLGKLEEGASEHA